MKSSTQKSATRPKSTSNIGRGRNSTVSKKGNKMRQSVQSAAKLSIEVEDDGFDMSGRGPQDQLTLGSIQELKSLAAAGNLVVMTGDAVNILLG